jgi:hypothetical protein
MIKNMKKADQMYKKEAAPKSKSSVICPRNSTQTNWLWKKND